MSGVTGASRGSRVPSIIYVRRDWGLPRIQGPFYNMSGFDWGLPRIQGPFYNICQVFETQRLLVQMLLRSRSPSLRALILDPLGAILGLS